MLRKSLFIKLTKDEEWLLLSASFSAKLVLVLTQEIGFSLRFISKPTGKT